MRRASVLVPLLAALAACGPRPEAGSPVPAPPPAAAAEPPAEAAAHRPTYPARCIPEEGCIDVCVLRDGKLVDVPVLHDPRTGDTTYLGRPFSQAFPADSAYVERAAWYVGNIPIMPVGERIPDVRYLKYGVPRVLAPTELEPAGVYRGVPFFAEAGSTDLRVVLYFPVRPGCVFHAFMTTGVK